MAAGRVSFIKHHRNLNLKNKGEEEAEERDEKEEAVVQLRLQDRKISQLGAFATKQSDCHKA